MNEVHIPLHWWLPTQAEFIEACHAHYAQEGLTLGDPSDGEWEEAHWPIPACMGGKNTALLLKEHHAIHGVIQSEELGHPCIWGWEVNYLPADYIPLFRKWKNIQSVLGGKIARERHGKRVRITYPDQSQQIALSMKHACELTGIPVGTIRGIINESKRTHTLAFEYAPAPTYWDSSNPSAPKPVLIHYFGGNVIYADSIKHASRLTNINQSTIQHRLKRTVEDQFYPIRTRSSLPLFEIMG
jgi:hypothetical protein